MRRCTAAFLLVLMVCSNVFAESSVWKAHRDGRTIYLGGTFHILRESDFPLPPEFDRAYQDTDVLYFETDIARMETPEVQQKLLAQAIYRDGSTIDKHLTARTYRQLSSYCEANDIPLQPLSQFKPAMLVTTITLLQLMKLGVSKQGVDFHYYELAERDHKPVKGLEPIDEHVNYVVSMADGNEDEFVSYSLKEMETIQAQFELLVGAWRKGDLNRLNTLMIAELKRQQPRVYYKLITSRNRKWLPQIDTQDGPRTKFVLVGAAHLVGPDGLIEALKRRGYRVEKL